MQITPQNYKKLLSKIQATIAKTQQNIVKSVDRQKVKMSWEIGRDIEGELKGKERSEYGRELIKQLTQDTAIARTALYQMHAFYKAYPKLPDETKALSWSHYRNLIAIKNSETRAQLENLVVEKNLGSNKLQQEISKTKKVRKKSAYQKDEGEVVKLRVTRGQIFNYKISGAAEIDLGFNVFVEVKNSFRAGEIVTVKKLGEKFSLKKSALKSNQIHTYKAELERVVDGDTIHVKLDLGFKIKHREILRLAKINAPEIKTPEGKKSSDALKKILKDVPFLIVKTNKTDIYGRYVADVFFDETTKKKTGLEGSSRRVSATKRTSNKDPQKIANEGVYLSQLLLDRKLAEMWVG